MLVAVEILITSALATPAQATQRATDIELILADCELAVEALAYPTNLAATDAGVPTGIIGASMRGPEGEGTPRIVPGPQQWSAGLMTTTILGSFIARATMRPEDFAATMVTLGGAELQEFFFGHDDDAFRNSGSGTAVASLIGQVSGTLLANAVAGERPSMEAGQAPGGRDRVRFAQASSHDLITPESFAAAAGERWCVWFVGNVYTFPSSSFIRLCEFGSAARFDLLSLHVASAAYATPGVNAGIHYDNGGSGANTGVADDSYLAAGTISAAVAASSPHQLYLQGTWQTMLQTPGLSARATGGGEALAVNRRIDADTGHGDIDLYCIAVFKMSGTDEPSGLAAMASLARSYYATSTL